MKVVIVGETFIVVNETKTNVFLCVFSFAPIAKENANYSVKNVHYFYLK